MHPDEILNIDCPVCHSSECPFVKDHCTNCGTPFDPQFVKNEFFIKAGKLRSTGILDNPHAKAALIGGISGLNWFLEEEDLYPKKIIKEDRVETPRVDPISEVVRLKRSKTFFTAVLNSCKRSLLPQWQWAVLLLIFFLSIFLSFHSRHEDPPKYVLRKGVSELDLISSPTVKSDPITAILPGEQFEKIESPISGWMKIKHDRAGYGYVWADYVIQYGGPPKYVLKKGVKSLSLRRTPSVKINSDPITLILAGEQFEKIEDPISGWMKIKLDRAGYGYVWAEHVVKYE